MRKFNVEDKVLCLKYELSEQAVFGKGYFGMHKYVNDEFFGREAVISDTYKNVMDKRLGYGHEDKDKYEITFLDTGEKLSWISGDELVPLVSMCINFKENE